MSDEPNPHKCPRCSGKMEEGIMIEHRVPLRWISGKPERTLLGTVKAGGKQHRQIESYRCTACGYLEAYARALIS